MLPDDETTSVTVHILSFSIPKIYPITDTRLSGLSHAEQVKQLIDGGAELIQLREKVAEPREFYRDSLQAVTIAHASGVKVIINDRVDIALAVGADGVHLGQEDIPPDAARELLGESAIIGFSTHSERQAIASAGFPVDYIAIGPVFATTTKQNPDALVGVEGVKSVVAVAGDMPIVAIGGITLENAEDVVGAGVVAIAVISGLFASTAPISKLMQAFIDRVADKTL